MITDQFVGYENVVKMGTSHNRGAATSSFPASSALLPVFKIATFVQLTFKMATSEEPTSSNVVVTFDVSTLKLTALEFSTFIMDVVATDELSS